MDPTLKRLYGMLSNGSGGGFQPTVHFRRKRLERQDCKKARKILIWQPPKLSGLFPARWNGI